MGRLYLVMCIAGCGRLGFDGDMASIDGSLDSGDATMATCDPPRRLCDAFDTPALDPRWQVIMDASVDTTHARSGTRSLRVHTNALAIGQDGYSNIAETSTLALGDPTVYIRVWMWLDALPVNNMVLVNAEETALAEGIGLFVRPDSLSIYSQFDGRSRITPSAPPLGAWTCLRWSFTRSTGAGSMVLDSDAGNATLAPVQTDKGTGISDLSFGIGFSGSTLTVAQPAMDVWLDDLIVSTAPVACSD